MTGPTQRTTRATQAEALDERTARELDAEQRLAEQHQSGQVLTTRPDWSPLPRRAGLKPTASALLSLRTPISSRAKWILGILSFLVPLAIWTLLSVTGAVASTSLPTPAAVVKAWLDMAGTGELFTDLWATTQRVLYGFGLAILVSVPLGIVMGTYAAGQAFFEPLIGLVRYLPPTAFIPLLTIWLGIDEPSKIALLFIGTVFYNTLMTADVVRNVPNALLDVSYTLGARRGEVLRKIVVPHALPGMIDSMRVNAAAAWNLVVVAELLAAPAGLGKRIAMSQRFLATDRMFALLAVIGLAGITIDILLRLVRQRVGKWVA